ncbi:MAG: hypothetical protein EOO20_03960 [Chryseobacterium sp.]|nr:MAG: hypothetical protein EOO20_03960 [Chryseobacterium sp.]
MPLENENLESNENQTIDTVPLAETIAGAKILGIASNGATNLFKISDIKGDGKGVAIASTDPGTPVLSQYYFAKPGVTYTNFKDASGNAITIPTQVEGKQVVEAKLVYNGTSWIADYIATEIQPTEIIDNITDGGANAALSAEAGKKLGEVLYGKVESDKNMSASLALDWFLIKNEPFQNSGILNTIDAVAYQAGKLKFQVVRRISATGESSGSAGVFIPIKDFTIDVLAGGHTYDISARNIDVEKGDYLGISKENPSVNNPPMYSEAVAIKHYSWTTYSSGILSGQAGTELRSYNAGFGYTILFEKTERKIITKTINVIPNANAFNSIKNLMDSINDASYYNRYELLVSKGNWFELDIRGKKYVKIVCHSEAVIYCDATQTAAKYVVPAGYPYTSEIGKQIATVPSTLLHVLFISADTELEGGTIKMIRGKYAAHIDSPSFKYAYFKNVQFESEQSIHPVGIGIWGGQHLIFEDCSYKSLDSEFGFAIHNTANQMEGSVTDLLNCKWIGCSYLKIDELGSNQKDIINLTNCTSDGRKSVLIAALSADGKNSFWKDANGNTTTNPLDVPHCLIVNDNGTQIDWLRIVFYFWSDYPNMYTRNLRTILNQGFSSYAFKAKCLAPVNKGDVVYQRNYAAPYPEVLRYTPAVTTPIGIALESGVAGDYIYCSRKESIAGANVGGNPFNSIAAAKLTYDGVNERLMSNDSALFYEVMAEALGSDIESRTFVKFK